MIADEAGRYTIYGAASLYTVTVSAFGYASHTLFAVPIVTGTITPRDVTLTPLPHGWVSGPRDGHHRDSIVDGEPQLFKMRR